MIAALAFAAYAALAVTRYARADLISYDLAIFEQAVRGYADLSAPVTLVKGPGFNVLGDHFHPILALLAPGYRIWPSPVLLLLAQSAALAVSAVPVTRLAIGRFGVARGVCLGLAYGASWGLQKAADFDFHEVAFAVPMLAFALEAVVRRRWWTATLWAVPLVLVKEDLGLTVAALGLVLLVRRRPREGAVLVVWGVVAFAVTVFVIMPAMNPDGHYEHTANLLTPGQEGAAAQSFGSMLLDLPERLFTPAQKYYTLAWVLLPTGLLALRSSLTLVAVPTLLWRFVSVNDHYWGLDYHYSAVLMPVVFTGFVEGIERGLFSPRPWMRAYARNMVPAALAAAVVLSANLPFRSLVHAETYEPGPRPAALARALEHIPDGAIVEADVQPLVRLAGRTEAYWLGNTRGVLPDYVVLDLDRWNPGPAPEEYAAMLHPGPLWVVVADERGFVVVRRGT